MSDRIAHWQGEYGMGERPINTSPLLEPPHEERERTEPVDDAVRHKEGFFRVHMAELQALARDEARRSSASVDNSTVREILLRTYEQLGTQSASWTVLRSLIARQAREVAGNQPETSHDLVVFGVPLRHLDVRALEHEVWRWRLDSFMELLFNAAVFQATRWCWVTGHPTSIDSVEAKDVAGDAVTQMVERIARSPLPVKAYQRYLKRIVATFSTRRLRPASQRQARVDLEEAESIAFQSPDDPASETQFLALGLLDTAIDNARISERDRDIFLTLGELSSVQRIESGAVQELAQRHGITPTTIRVVYMRTRIKVRREFTKLLSEEQKTMLARFIGFED